MKYILEKKITFLYYIAITLLLVLFLVFYLNTEKLKASVDGIAQTQQSEIVFENIIFNSDILLNLLVLVTIVIIALVVIITRNQKIRNKEFKEISASQKALSQYSLSLIEASLDPLVTINNQGKITDMNEATVNITGIDRDKLVGSDFFDYFTEPQKAREVYQNVFSKGFVVDLPLTIRHKDGKLTDVLFNGSVYKDDVGNVLGVVIVARDIAEQKWAVDLRNANKELAFQNEEKENRAAELIIANKELAFQNDEKESRAAELVIANKELAFQNDEKESRAAELVIANKELAFQNDEKESRAAELVIANKELAFQNDEKESRAAELVIANVELAYQNRVKEKRAAELIIANKELAFQNDEKEKRAAELIIANKELAFQNDEKEKRAAELIIANYARSIIEASLDPLITISPEGKITDMNEAFSKITETPRQELIDSDFFDYFTEHEKARDVYQEVFANGFVTDYPLTINGAQRTDVLFNGSVYKDDKGNVLGAVVVARDITEQKIIQKEILEAKIFAEEATLIAEEAKTKAEEATKIAEDSVRSKQQFLSNMSHEIRTPMNAIIGFTKVVLKTDLSAKQKQYLTAIKMSGDALIVLINDILDLAKVDAGKMSFEQTPFKLSLSISAMLHLFETKIKEKNLELVTVYDKNIPEVLIGDSVRLHQIILNLVSNAVKFTSKGKITVSIKLLSETKDEMNIQFSIADTGIGIKEDKMDSIFENFQQATSETSRIYGGTGLGLAIVKQLVDAQNGSVEVKSVLNEGSDFSFVLPFRKTNAEAVLDVEILELQRETKDIKILVVEDMELNQLLMKTLLDDFGFECDITANGKLAIEKLETKTYDIILMDLQMPEMNGFEATEYIRNVMHSDIPIMALTADVTTVDLAKCKAVGMNDYLSKPVDERLLYSKIIGLIKKPVVIIEHEMKGKMTIEKVKYVDLQYLTKLTKANPVLMSEMIDVYLKQTPPLITSMKESVLSEDWTALRAAAHKMMPSFAIMGLSPDHKEIAMKIQGYAADLELSGEINELVLQLESVCNNAYEELHLELKNLKTTN
ncbi:ATP-binding protein [Flavobacterium sp. GT3R68]|uniref:ATP-binding protein n=1 Tax=Flavobacterium sp. GT3R68 TaxID=2594437 RepID=UPI000F86F670|nr:ATP-binding protein [Flavobacterium sp. GT3R68]RTY95136.1 response regulator [Flavobacterium sp. GSN2]TRW91122.1 response regulator [Flavobacterium sp. GT3R68]